MSPHNPRALGRCNVLILLKAVVLVAAVLALGYLFWDSSRKGEQLEKQAAHDSQLMMLQL